MDEPAYIYLVYILDQTQCFELGVISPQSSGIR